MSITAYIALGSNLGDRQDFLDRAVALLRQRSGMAVVRVSTYHETEPVGGPPGQGPYLNAAAAIRTEMSPRDLLTLLRDVEQALGRVRREREGPRTIDLDLLLYDSLILAEADLIVPHPRMHERRFVLGPIVEIAPDVVHPVFGRTSQELLTKLLGGDFPQPAPAPTTEPVNAPVLKDLAGRKVVVTGSTSGIGRAIALRLARAGADVVVHGRRADAAQGVANEILEAGVQAAIALADLKDEAVRGRLVEQAWQAFGSIDVWINNAGADTLTGEAGQWSFERKLAELWAIDVAATVALSREVGRRMKQGAGGVLLNLGWDQAETGMEGDSGQLFALAKGAVMAFTRSLALELAPKVRVNCLAPGWIRTAWGAEASARWQLRVVRETPLARWGTPEDVAAAAHWLVSPEAEFVTGQILRVNGGAVR